MSTICPTILAPTIEEYREGLKRINFANRIQIDIADGKFTQPQTVNATQVYWEPHQKADIHVMFDDPYHNLEVLIAKQPNLIILHAESSTFTAAFEELVSLRIPTGVALLPKTRPEEVRDCLLRAQHCLIFGGALGSYGGEADLSQLDKAQAIKKINPSIEIGWDGGANSRTTNQIAAAGVDVINVGSAIQKATNPQEAYATLTEMISGDA